MATSRARGCGLVLAGVLAIATTSAEARSLAEIRASGVLRVCVAGSSAGFYRANGEAFARFLGLRAEVKELASFDQQFQNDARLLADGSCDVYPNDLQITPSRESMMRLVPYYQVRNVIVAHRDQRPALKGIDDLAGRTAAVQKGTNYERWIEQANRGPLSGNPVKVIDAPTLQSVRLVAEGKADFTVLGTESALRWIREDVERLVLAFAVDEAIAVGWGVAREAPALAEELRRFFNANRKVDSPLDANWRQYYRVSLMEYQLFEDSFSAGRIDLKRILGWAVPGGIAALAILLAMLFWNRRLNQTEKWYRSVVESSPDGMIVVDERGVMRIANHGMQQIFGYAPEDLAGRNVSMLLPEEIRDRHGSYLESFFRSPSHRAMGALRALHGVGADGRRVPLEISLSPLPAIGGRPAMVAATIRDVTERRAAEEALRVAHDEQSAIFESATAGIALVRNTRIDRCNRRLEEMFGYGRGEAVGRSLQELMGLPEEERAETAARARAQLAKGETYRRERLLARRDGGAFWCRLSGHAIDPGDLAKGSVWILQDVTEEHAAADALRTANERLDLAQEAGNVGVFDVEVGGRNTWTPQMERIFGLQPGTFGGTVDDWAALLHPEDRERARRGFEQALAGSGNEFVDEFRVVRPDGGVRWLQSICRILRGPDGRAQRAVGVNIDVTDLLNARRAAEEATRAKSMFLASMSHEIRTPMNGVLGMLQLLALTRLDADQKASLDTVRDSARSLLRIIDDVLDFSKIEAGRLELRPEATSVAALVESVRRVYSGVAGAKDLILGTAIDPRISPALVADPLRLRQILNNFASNAIKFTDKGKVEIGAVLEAREDGKDRVRFYVSDTGIGVSKEAQAQLFQPYVQASLDTARRYGGTGLGLTICRRLAELMQGTIAMESEPGKGTTMTFTVALPIGDARELPKSDTTEEAAALVASRRRAPTVEAARAEGTLVLIAEDHPTNRTVLTRLLNLLGYATVAAENGREALEKWQAGGIAALVTDCDMPEMDGYELARRIRQSGKPRIPIIACTASALADDLQRCTAAGMDDFVAKPIEFQALAKVLERWLPLPAGEGAGAPMTIDASSLAQVTGGDAAMEREILADFRIANQLEMASLRDALAGRRMADIARASHRIKGACLTIGAAALAEVCARVEEAARQNNWRAVAAEQQALEREFERLHGELHEGSRA